MKVLFVPKRHIRQFRNPAIPLWGRRHLHRESGVHRAPPAKGSGLLTTDEGNHSCAPLSTHATFTGLPAFRWSSDLQRAGNKFSNWQYWLRHKFAQQVSHFCLTNWRTFRSEPVRYECTQIRFFFIDFPRFLPPCPSLDRYTAVTCREML